MAPRARVAVVGAGLAGLACAAGLREAGHTPVVFEKSRGTGGRLATRRAAGTAFDHGAQYLTARDAEFAAWLRNREAEGAAARWRPRREGAADGETWWVGRPGMSALVKPLAAGIEVRTGTRVERIARRREGWILASGTGGEEAFEACAVTAPAPQAAELVRGLAPAFGALDRVTLRPCWALLVAFSRPLGGLPDVIPSPAPPLAWIARDASKPGRATAPEAWVAHADPAWSDAHLERSADEVGARLLEALGAALGRELPPPQHVRAHRWRYARADRVLGAPCLVAADGRLGVAGDACLAPRAEAAFVSGRALARALGEALV